MLASMSEINPGGEMPLVDWSELSVSGLLPSGTVTLLLGDIEGSTRRWESQPGEMTAALARLNQAVSEIIATHDGIRPVEQGEGDSFVAAFARLRRGGGRAGVAARPPCPDPASMTNLSLWYRCRARLPITHCGQTSRLPKAPMPKASRLSRRPRRRSQPPIGGTLAPETMNRIERSLALILGNQMVETIYPRRAYQPSHYSGLAALSS